MIVIVDTNIVLSAVIRDRLPQRVIDEIVGHDDWIWLVTPDIDREYREVLRRPKFALPDEVYHEWVAVLESATILIEPAKPPPSFLRDPKDAPFLAAALASGADFFITGDKDFEEAQQLVATRIITVAEFAELFSIS